MHRAPRPRGSLLYDKPPLNLDGLVERLAERGLEIPEPDRAGRYLRHIGYEDTSGAGTSGEARSQADCR